MTEHFATVITDLGVCYTFNSQSPPLVSLKSGNLQFYFLPLEVQYSQVTYIFQSRLSSRRFVLAAIRLFLVDSLHQVQNMDYNC